MKTLFAVLATALFAVPSYSQSSPSSLRTRILQNALNPKISVIPDFVVKSGEQSGKSGAELREVEVGFQSEIDSYGRLDAFIAFPGGEEGKVEVEEAYATLTALPWSLQARGGKFFANFSRLNMVHSHELPQVDRPLVLSSFLGDEGMRSLGGELSWAGGIGGLYLEAVTALTEDLGEEEEAQTADITTPGGNTIKVSVVDEESPSRALLRDYGQIARLRAYTDLSDSTNLEIGVSGATHRPKGGEHRRLGGLDLTFRWRPPGKGLYRSFLWRTEGVWRNSRLLAETDIDTGAVTEAAGETRRKGFYTYAEWRFARRWSGGARWDYAESPTHRDVKAPTTMFSPYVTFNLSEFNRLRAQFSSKHVAGANRNEKQAFLQWTMILGPHGAHAF